MHTYLQERILQRSNCTQPKLWKEPYPYRMLAAQANLLARLALTPT
jgi:hypothetical protein